MRPADVSCPCISPGLGTAAYLQRNTSYGSYCSAWDSNNAFSDVGCSNETQTVPEYCEESWCYVDEVTCFSSEIEYWSSDFFPGMYYSYETCGYSGKTWTNSDPFALRGETIRISIPAIFYPEHYLLDSNDNIIPYGKDLSTVNFDELLGIFPDFFREVAKAAEFNYTFHEISNSSRTKYSTWTSCVRDVQKGLIDMCVGAFWDTEERRLMTDMSTRMVLDQFIFRTSIFYFDDSSFEASNILAVFQPFSVDLWIALIACLFGLIGIIALIEYEPGDSFWILMDNMYYGIQWYLLPVNRVEETLLNYINMDPESIKHMRMLSHSSQLIIGVLYITLLLFIFIYTSASVTHLTGSNNRSRFQFESLEDCAMSADCIACVSSPMNESLIALHPTLKLYLSVDEDSLLADYESQHCNSIIVSKLTYEMNPKVRSCDQETVGLTAIARGIVWPMNRKYVSSMNYHITNLMNAGKLQSLYDEYTLASVCVGNSNPDLYQATARSCSGIFSFVIVSVSLALSYRIYEMWKSGCKAGKRDEKRQLKKNDIMRTISNSVLTYSTPSAGVGTPPKPNLNANHSLSNLSFLQNSNHLHPPQHFLHKPVAQANQSIDSNILDTSSQKVYNGVKSGPNNWKVTVDFNEEDSEHFLPLGKDEIELSVTSQESNQMNLEIRKDSASDDELFLMLS